MFSLILIPTLAWACDLALQGDTVRLEGRAFTVAIDPHSGAWFLVDHLSGVRWPTEGTASAGKAKSLEGGFVQADAGAGRVLLRGKEGNSVTFALEDDARALEIRFSGKGLGEVRLLGDCLLLTDREAASVIVPSREGLLIPASSGVSFRQVFGSSEYEGCHMNMLGLIKSASTLIVTWDDSNIWPELRSTLVAGKTHRQELATELTLRDKAHAVRVTPLGKGDWNTLAAGYRRIAENKGLAVTLRQKCGRDPHEELLLGAANVKLWTCLERRMSEDSTRVESVKVHWTFNEAAQVAEHLRRDLNIDRCLFTIGGWTEGGYDCRHPDDMPANSECGGDQALADAIGRIQQLGFVACLHDNYQDMYKDSKSWDPALIQKHKDGSLAAGGRWLGGRAYLVCATKQVELAMRPQNLPAIRERFAPHSYFIDTTYAVGPQECFDPRHPLGRNDDIEWKIGLSDAARKTFGLFGSECGREWALPHSDFFEGLVGVAGRSFHNLKPETLGASVIPFWEMVYHDCQVCFGKYGYDAARAGEYVVQHVLAARPLHYHSIPDHLYWKTRPPDRQPTDDRACYMRTDRGWSEGLHPLDAFLKTTHEVLGPLNLATAHYRLTRFEFLGRKGNLRRATYGEGEDATVVVVNDGSGEVLTASRLGGTVVLPPWGFVVDGSRFAAFLARQWNGRDYPEGALFTLRPEGGQRLAEAGRLRIFHAFGDPRIDWRGSTHEVRREAVIEIAK
jgi:hypothetical protein